MFSRSFLAFAVAAGSVLALVPGGSAQAALTEADVIRLARTKSAQAAVADATDSLATARAESAGLRANPSLGWDREAVSAAAGGAQDVLRATLPVDLAGPAAARTLEAARSESLRAEATLMRDDAALVAVDAYYDVLWAKDRVAALAAAVVDLDEAARVLASREAAGASSGYESTRLSLASELGRSRHADAVGALEAARVQLAGLLGQPADALQLDAAPTLLTVEEAQALGQRGVGGRAAIRTARGAERLAADAERSADWTWLPTFEVSGGLKHADAGGPGGADFGYAVGLQLGLPFFDHGQAAQSEARAQRALAAARAQSLSRAAQTEALRALVRYQVARAELERFELRTAEHVGALLAAAKSGYAEGERSIVELLDAQRALTEIAERRLALYRNAKRAEARLRSAVGDL